VAVIGNNDDAYNACLSFGTSKKKHNNTILIQ